MEVKSGSQLLRRSRQLLADVVHQGNLLLLRNIDFREHDIWVAQAQFECVKGVTKLIIEVPTEVFVEVDELALKSMRRQSEDEVDDLGLIKLLLLLINIGLLDGLF